VPDKIFCLHARDRITGNTARHRRKNDEDNITPQSLSAEFVLLDAGASIKAELQITFIRIFGSASDRR
jgi:hypothetical protein